jgi:hypothetical protein
MKEKSIQSYLRKLEQALWLRGLSHADTLEEIESHLLESMERGIRQGLDQGEAEREALKRFGSVRVVTSTFIKERLGPMQKILQVCSLPTWIHVPPGMILEYWQERSCSPAA